MKNLQTVPTADLIAGSHISDVELFGCFDIDLPCGKSLYEFKKIPKVRKPALRDLMGNPGQLVLKSAATATEPAEFTMVRPASGDEAFRAARVAQLAKLYQSAQIDPLDGCDKPEIEIPCLTQFYTEYVK